MTPKKSKHNQVRSIIRQNHGRGNTLKKSGKGWLTSPNLLAKKPRIGWAMFLGGTIVFVLLAINLLANGPLIDVDIQVTNTLHDTALRISEGLLDFIKLGWNLGDTWVFVLGALLALYLIIKRYWQEFWMGFAGNIGGPLIFLALSHIFNRHRPVFSVPVGDNPTGPGFPSGHAIIAVTFFGLIAYLLLPSLTSRLTKGLVILITLLIILFIGFSRIFTGGHYLTDILAGYAVGVAWFGLSYTAVENHFLHRKKRKKEVDCPIKTYEQH